MGPLAAASAYDTERELVIGLIFGNSSVLRCDNLLFANMELVRFVCLRESADGELRERRRSKDKTRCYAECREGRVEWSDVVSR